MFLNHAHTWPEDVYPPGSLSRLSEVIEQCGIDKVVCFAPIPHSIRPSALKENPWADEFQIVYYHLWHHEGRRARQGAMMAGPDYAHWHGFFELQQDLYKLQDIYEKRIETGEIE